MDREQLKQFIYKASRATYASGDESIKQKQDDGSTTIRFQEGDFVFQDNYFGGEPYGGREIVFYKEKPLWMMVYYGSVYEGNRKNIYSFLIKALSNNTIDMPYRGPSQYWEDKLLYENNISGAVEKFSGTEKIYMNKICIYEANYIGGLVDQ